MILDGRIARDFYKKKITERVKNLSALGCTPKLAILQIGDNAESNVYIEQKKKFALSIGALVEHIRIKEDVTEQFVAGEIGKLNERHDVHGIILQLPVPGHLDKLALINHIDPRKDVDGLTDENQILLEKGGPRFIPATAKGVILLLDFYNIDLKNKKVAVLGRSRLVGHPTAEILRSRGAHVTVCHSKTEHTKEITRNSDIVVVAIGKPQFITRDYIKDGATVVDVGINSVKGQSLQEETPKRKLVGDVDFEAVSSIARAISPVPGGVGPMTVLSLFDNLVVSAESFIS